MMASPLTKVSSTATALDSTAKIGTQAGISVDLLSPNAFSEIVANFGNETVAGSSINAIPPEIEPALDTAPINNSVNFLLGDNSNAQLLIDPPDLVAMTRLLPFAIGNVISKQEDSNGIQLSAHQIGGDITPTSEMPSVTFLANAHDLISGTPPTDELGGPLPTCSRHAMGKIQFWVSCHLSKAQFSHRLCPLLHHLLRVP
jgi:hypothetical protein